MNNEYKQVIQAILESHGWTSDITDDDDNGTVRYSIHGTDGAGVDIKSEAHKAGIPRYMVYTMGGTNDPMTNGGYWMDVILIVNMSKYMEWLDAD